MAKTILSPALAEVEYLPIPRAIIKAFRIGASYYVTRLWPLVQIPKSAYEFFPAFGLQIWPLDPSFGLWPLSFAPRF